MKIKLLFISVFAFIHSSYAQVTSVNWGDLNDKATAIGKLFINANGEV